MTYPSTRLYPQLVPPFEGEPTPDRLQVTTTEKCGQALVAMRKFEAGEQIFRFAGITIPHQTLFTLQLMPGVYIHDPWVMGKVLHSCSPNAHCDMESRVFTATRPIEIGEPITMDYETTEDYLFQRFDCHCGSQQCRGTIKGRLA